MQACRTRRITTPIVYDSDIATGYGVGALLFLLLLSQILVMAVNKCFCCGRSLPPPWRLARLHLPPFPPLLVGSHSTCDPPFACRSSPSCPKVQRSQKKDLVCAYGEGSQTATLGHIRKKNEESWMATMPNRLVAKWFPDEGRESWVRLEFFNCSSSHF